MHTLIVHMFTACIGIYTVQYLSLWATDHRSVTAIVAFLHSHLSFFLLSHINWFMSLLTPGFNIQPLFSSYMCEAPFPSPTCVSARDDKAKSRTVCLVGGIEEETWIDCDSEVIKGWHLNHRLWMETPAEQRGRAIKRENACTKPIWTVCSFNLMDEFVHSGNKKRGVDNR